MRTADGEVIGVGGVIMEITDRKRADDRLRLLAEAGELFSSSLDREEIAARIARVAVPRLADSCNVYLAVERHARAGRCVSVDRTPSRAAAAARSPVAARCSYGEPLPRDATVSIRSQLGADRALERTARARCCSSRSSPASRRSG